MPKKSEVANVKRSSFVYTRIFPLGSDFPGKQCRKRSTGVHGCRAHDGDVPRFCTCVGVVSPSSTATAALLPAQFLNRVPFPYIFNRRFAYVIRVICSSTFMARRNAKPRKVSTITPPHQTVSG